MKILSIKKREGTNVIPLRNKEKAKAPEPQAPKVTSNQLKARLAILTETALHSRRELLQKLTDPRRDFDAECGYPDEITPEVYRDTYDRLGIAHRVVELLPKETWAMDPMVYETVESKDEDEAQKEDTEFDKAWKILVKKRNVWHHLQRIDEVSGIGRFGVLFLGFSDGQELDQPVLGVEDPQATPKSELVGNQEEEKFPLSLLYMRSLDESLVQVLTREDNLNSPRYGKPKTYSLQFKDQVLQTSSNRTLTVHWSRVLHVAEDCLDSGIYGTPRMQAVFNHLMDIKKILGGSGEMFWRGGFPGYSFEVAPGSPAETELDEESLVEQIDEYAQGLSRYLKLVGVTAKSLAPQVADPTAHFEANLLAIAITMGCPLRVLKGTEESKLASTQDKKTWNLRLARRQDTYVTPMIIREFVDRLMDAGVLPMVEEYEVAWPDLNAATDSEKADIALKRTQALAAYVAGNVDALIAPPEFLELIMGMELEDIAEIIEAMKTYQGSIAAEAAAKGVEATGAAMAALNPEGTIGGAGKTSPGASGSEDGDTTSPEPDGIGAR